MEELSVALEHLSEALREVCDCIGKAIVDAVQLITNQFSKWVSEVEEGFAQEVFTRRQYTLYKTARKNRTRKKYRNRLWREIGRKV